MDAKMNIKVFFIHGKDIKLISGKQFNLWKFYNLKSSNLAKKIISFSVSWAAMFLIKNNKGISIISTRHRRK
jgi:hypothetical protein